MKTLILVFILFSAMAAVTAASAEQFCYVDQWNFVHCCTPNAYGGCF